MTLELPKRFDQFGSGPQRRDTSRMWEGPQRPDFKKSRRQGRSHIDFDRDAKVPPTFMKQTIAKNTSIYTVIRLGALAAVISAGNLFAAPSAVEGHVRDGNGRPIAGAEVQIEARNRPWTALVKSDARGHYSYDGLTAGATYRVTLLINGTAKAAINNVLAKAGSTELNFDLKNGSVGGDRTVVKNGKRYVYIPSETGSHLGGRWVEVDENGQANSVGANNVERAGSEALRRMQSNSGSVGGAGSLGR